MLFLFILALFTSSGECDKLYQAVGKDILLHCGLPQNSDIEWKFNDKLIINIKGKSGTSRKGDIVKKAVAHGDTLKVPKLEQKDSGVYSCAQKKYTVHVVHVFVKPGPVLVQSSAAELHCDIGGNSKAEVQWLKPPGNEKYTEKSQMIHLKSVTSSDEGQWTCVINDLKLSLELTVVASLQTKDVEVDEGGQVELPCSLPRLVSQRILGGGWKADHLQKVSFPTLKNTENLRWNGRNSSDVQFNTGILSTNFNIMLINVNPNFKGKYVCTVEFDGGAKLTAETNLNVTLKNKGGKVVRKTTVTGYTSTGNNIMNQIILGLQIWVWIAIGISSVVLIVVIIVIAITKRRNRRKEMRVRKLRSMRQPLTAKCYCQCNRSEIELGQQERPLPTPRKQHNLRTPAPNNGYE